MGLGKWILKLYPKLGNNLTDILFILGEKIEGTAIDYGSINVSVIL